MVEENSSAADVRLNGCNALYVDALPPADGSLRSRCLCRVLDVRLDPLDPPRCAGRVTGTALCHSWIVSELCVPNHDTLADYLDLFASSYLLCMVEGCV